MTSPTQAPSNPDRGGGKAVGRGKDAVDHRGAGVRAGRGEGGRRGVSSQVRPLRVRDVESIILTLELESASVQRGNRRASPYLSS